MAIAADFPDELHYHVEHQTWARLHDDGTATVGITALGLLQAGELYMCRPRPVGTVVAAGRSVAVVELAKAIVSVRSPVGGTIVEINPQVSAVPDLINRAPYGDGWLARLRLDDFAADRETLVHGDGVAAAMQAFAQREGLA
ncbi:MAG: glycine cleavage system protein H [Lautropia sp.]